VDVLKVDHSFVAGLGKDTTDEALVRALIEMAHALDLDVVAEGVETQEQCDHLRRLGCNYLQGYLFSRPLVYDALLDLLQSVRSEAPETAAPTRRAQVWTTKTVVSL
jgi:EAL domain-containing protein (putative c-di-GMP-specific phosphodiesterase class I)